jgi:tetratricopeptide (TPR) repeat protein
MNKPKTRDYYPEAISLFERALVLDPRSVEAQAWLAIALTGRVLDDMTDTAEADIVRAEGLAGLALAASPRSGFAHYAKGQVLRAQRRFAEAIPAYETVLALDPSWAAALVWLGQCKLLTGAIDQTIPLVERALWLSPRGPHIGARYAQIGYVHLLQSRIDEAIIWLERARGAFPAHAAIRARLAAAYALQGETERAAAELTEARKLSRDDRYSSIARLKASQYFGVPKIRALIEASYFAGLRKGGMPEE